MNFVEPIRSLEDIEKIKNLLKIVKEIIYYFVLE